MKDCLEDVAPAVQDGEGKCVWVETGNVICAAARGRRRRGRGVNMMKWIGLDLTGFLDFYVLLENKCTVSLGTFAWWHG